MASSADPFTTSKRKPYQQPVSTSLILHNHAVLGNTVDKQSSVYPAARIAADARIGSRAMHITCIDSLLSATNVLSYRDLAAFRPA
eukprot:IDg6343t1